MEVLVRLAHPLDASQMAELLNDIIAIGGTTALTGAVEVESMRSKFREPRSAWHVAEDNEGAIPGFQYIATADYLPADAAEIATFAKAGQQGLGIGSKLFEATRRAAIELGYTWINANIRADNVGGLAYYQSRGFEDYSRINGYIMDDGTVVDKILKRYDLR